MAQAAFSALIHGDVPTLIEFYTDWSASCKALRPVLTELKNSFDEKIRILEIDVDRNPSLAQLLEIRSVPTLAIFKEGELKWIRSGVLDREQLEDVAHQYTVTESNALR